MIHCLLVFIPTQGQKYKLGCTYIGALCFAEINQCSFKQITFLHYDCFAPSRQLRIAYIYVQISTGMIFFQIQSPPVVV